MNANVHVVIAGLPPPQGLAPEAIADLPLPALATLLGRAQTESLQSGTLEDWLCAEFGIRSNALAPVLLQGEGLDPGSGYWMRADPVALSLMRDRVVLQPAGQLSREEAQQFCACLNDHFSRDGLQFIAPHPQRWYLRLESSPDVQTRSLTQVAGQDMHEYLPVGNDALYWHGLLNEVQMLLYGHPLNTAREAEGHATVGGVWFWGGGCVDGKPAGHYTRMVGDSELAMAVGRAAAMHCEELLPDAALEVAGAQPLLVVTERLQPFLLSGDLAGWRDMLVRLERDVAMPLLRSLQSGRIDRVRLDLLQAGGARRHIVTRRDLWKFWRRPAVFSGQH